MTRPLGKLPLALCLVALARDAAAQGTLVRDDNPSRGPANAPVTVVLFSDFQCPFCARVRPTVDEVMESYPRQVRLVFRHFPLARHPHARRAAEAAACAGEQGRFWEMYASLFTHRSELDEGGLKKQARDVGLGGPAFDRCLDRGLTAHVVERDASDGAALGVTGTPTFFVNGRMFEGALSKDDLEAAVRAALGR